MIPAAMKEDVGMKELLGCAMVPKGSECIMQTSTVILKFLNMKELLLMPSKCLLTTLPSTYRFT